MGVAKLIAREDNDPPRGYEDCGHDYGYPLSGHPSGSVDKPYADEKGTNGASDRLVRLDDLPGIFDGFDDEMWATAFEDKGANGPES